MRPSVSRAVHLHNVDGECLAATVTRVRPSGRVDLFVTPPASNPYNALDVEQADPALLSKPPVKGWHWPEVLLEADVVAHDGEPVDRLAFARPAPAQLLPSQGEDGA